MRDQLHLMELVDNYLDGTMNNNDRAAFEERLRTNEELRVLVEDQEHLRRAARRSPVRAEAKAAYRKYRWGRMLPSMGIGLVLLIAAIASVFLWNTPSGTHESGETDPNTAVLRILDDTTGTHLEPFVVAIDPKRDTTLSTPGGIVLDIPKGAFVDSLGVAIKSPVRVSVVEALDPLDIMKAGLSTMTGTMLLETGGMFHLDAQANGKMVKIDPTKPLTAMVPATQGQRGMQLYAGVKKEDGTIDWRDPQPLKKSLIPVDINTLNFYPPEYLNKLKELGKDVTDKQYTDSLYFSFSGAVRRQWIMGPEENDVLTIDSAKADTTYATFDGVDPSTYRNVGIDPAKVKTIWNDRFNGTNLATREFEERMRSIHGTCDNEVLELYVKNLDKDLSKIDSLVFSERDLIFGDFAERNDGRVDLPPHAADRLRTYYENQSRTEAEAIRKTQEKFWNEQRKQDVRSNAKQADHALAESVREGELFAKEFEANLDTVYKQLGIQRVRLPRSAWVVPVVGTGWWNVDKAVLEATTTRSSMSYTDDKTGKTATLTYNPLTIQLADRTSYDQLVVYLLPKQLNSYQRVKEDKGLFSERLNSIFQYELFCLGMKEGQQYAFHTAIDGVSELDVTLVPADDNVLRQMLRTKGKIEDDLLQEANYLRWLDTDDQRRRTNQKKMELREALLPVVFPCLEGDIPAAAAVDSTPAYE
ncbi:MAG: hypothetical protein JNM62_02810 [Flavobacteriales bacterium]|nr:hypothetical protein [Flavobacteriales bacterium]